MLIETKNAKSFMEDMKNAARKTENFGPDFNVDDNSDWYRQEYPKALACSNLSERITDMADNMDLSKANGYWFWKGASNFLFFRKLPTASQSIVKAVDCIVGAKAQIGEIKLRKKGTDIIYSNLEALEVLQIPFTFSIASETTGSMTNAEIGEITELISSTENWGSSFSNIEKAEGGQDLETLEEGRKRYFNGNNSDNFWNTDGIYTAISNLRGVKSVSVKQNNKDTAIDGIPRRSVHCVVDGGIDIEIAKTIFLKCLPATFTYGEVRKTVQAINGELIEVGFDRPVDVGVDCKIEIYGHDNILEVKNQVIEYIATVGIGGIVSRSMAQEYVASNVSNFSKYKNVDIFFKKDGTTTWNSFIAMGNTERPVYKEMEE